MKVERLTLDEDQLPDAVTVTMTRAEMAAIARLFGGLNGYALARLGLPDDEFDPYGALCGGVIHRYWEDGVNDLLPKLDLATINKPPPQKASS